MEDEVLEEGQGEMGDEFDPVAGEEDFKFTEELEDEDPDDRYH